MDLDEDLVEMPFIAWAWPPATQPVREGLPNLRNKQVNKIRYVIEQAIANFKTWRIMHTDVALHFCVGSWVWRYG